MNKKAKKEEGQSRGDEICGFSGSKDNKKGDYTIQNGHAKAFAYDCGKDHSWAMVIAI